MALPYLSIIIPVYNAEKTIARALKSILNQHTINFEILLINDGSTDNSLSIMERFAVEDLRIRIFSQENSGVSTARNLGICEARGQYITFLDADDYYAEKGLEKILAEMDPDTELVIFGYYIEYGNRTIDCNPQEHHSLFFTEEESFRKYAMTLIENEIINAPWNKIYLASYLKEINLLFSPDMDMGEDLKFNLAFLKDVKKVKVFDQPFVHYSVKKGEGLVSKFRPNRLDLRYGLLMELRDLLSYWGKLTDHQAVINRMLIRDIMAYFMDFYKSSCPYSEQEKLEKTNEVISRKDIREQLTIQDNQDLFTRILRLILSTNNCRLILLAAKILTIKRVL